MTNRKKRKLTAVLAILLVLAAGILTGCERKPTVGVAWSNTQDSESFKATCDAIREAGGEPVVLDQVLSADIEYDDDSMITDAKDEDGVLTPEAAKLVRCNTWQGSNAEDVMEGMTAVVFPGGMDISPSLYFDPQKTEALEGYSAERDVSDYLLMNYCLENDISVLAICRGMQMLSVVSGADMIQDIPSYMESLDRDYNYEHRNEPEEEGGYRDFALHDVTVTDRDSILYDLTGSDTIKSVPSWHHQAVKSVEGTRLSVTATVETSGVTMIEAVERKDKSFVLALQYHPEIAVVRRTDEKAKVYFTAIVKEASNLGTKKSQ